MKKFLLLFLSMLTTLWASAYDYQCNGIYYVLYDFNETAYVTYASESYSSYSGTVNIPDHITTADGVDYDVVGIDFGAFRGSTELTKVTIATGIKTIGMYAFYGCTGLTEIVIPNSVTSIGNNAFDGCKSLTSVTVGSSVTSIQHYAFSDCTALTAVNITDIEAWCKISFSSRDSNPLYYAHQLYLNGVEVKDLVIPASVSNIGYSAFSGCSSLTSVTIPNSVTSIEASAFYGCSALTSVTIPNSVTSIEASAFSGCSSLTSVTIPNSVTSVGGSAFSNCSSLTSITIPESVKRIEERTFCYCNSLTTINIPESVTSIEKDAFRGCSALTSINIPNSVTTIGDYAFQFCSALTSVNIGNSVTTIGHNAFESCESLSSVTLPNSVTSIGKSAFYWCLSLTSVTLSNSVTTIGQNAFSNCSSLTSINIPNSLTEIAQYTFFNCESLSSITLPASVTSIGNNAFYCEALQDVYCYNPIPPTCENGSFGYCENKAKLHILQGSKKEYTSASTWQKFRSIIEDLNTEEDDDSDVNITANRISVNDKNGNNRVSIGDITYTIGGALKGESYTTDDIESITKHLLGKRNAIVVWLSSGKQNLYYFNNTPIIRCINDNIIIEKADGSEKIYPSDDILKITYDYILVKDSHEYVDLGLPSGTLWASCNIGANSPEEYGDYFAWGEIESKGYYDWSTYKYCQGNGAKLTKYNANSSHGIVDNKTELDIEDDAAYVNWGPDWRIPNFEQQEELRDTNNCTWTWSTQNGVNGYLVTSEYNSNSIFLPAAGFYDRGNLNYVGSEGNYWSRSLERTSSSYSLMFGEQWTDWYDSTRSLGFPIRPVRQ